MSYTFLIYVYVVLRPKKYYELMAIRHSSPVGFIKDVEHPSIEVDKLYDRCIYVGKN